MSNNKQDSFTNISGAAALKEAWAQEEGTGGFQPYLTDDRDITALLNDWWSIPYNNQKETTYTSNIAEKLGLADTISETEIVDLLSGKAIPGEKLADFLSQRVPKHICSAMLLRAKAAISRLSGNLPVLDKEEILKEKNIYKKRRISPVRVGPHRPRFPYEKIIPLMPANDQATSLWICLDNYFEKFIETLSPLNLKNLTGSLQYEPNNTNPIKRKLLGALSACTEMDPWQICGVMPLYHHQTNEDATKKLTTFFFPNGQDECDNLDLNRQEFFDKAHAHFNSIKGIDIAKGLQMFPKTIGEVTRICRVRLNLTQKELASRVGFKGKSCAIHINYIENNITRIPLKKIDKFVHTLELTGQDAEYFYQLAGYPSPTVSEQALQNAASAGEMLTAAENILRLYARDTRKALGGVSLTSIENIKNGGSISPSIADKIICAFNFQGEPQERFIKLSGNPTYEESTRNIENAGTTGDFIKLARERVGLSQSTLANALGYKKHNSISYIENNIHIVPREKMPLLSWLLELSEKENEILFDLYEKQQPVQDPIAQPMGIAI